MLNKVILSILSIIISCKAIAEEQMKKVYIAQVVEHQALNQTRNGIIKGLEDVGFVKGKNLEIKLENAQNSPLIGGQIAKKFLANDPDVMVSIGTNISQIFFSNVRTADKKMVFASVTNPVSAGLIKIKGENKNVTGVSNYINLDLQLAYFKELLPNLKRLGTIYNPSEDNSVYMLEDLKNKAANFGVEIVAVQASNAVEVSQSTSSLIDKKVDAIFINNDNNALSSFAVIAKISNSNNVPVFVSDIDLVPQGALAALGPDQFKLGIQTGKIIARILNGEEISNIKFEYPESLEKVINKKMAKKYSLKLPQK